MKNKKAQQMIELQVLNSQLKQLEEQAKMIEQQIIEIQMTEMNLDEIKNKKDKDIIFPLNSGIFAEGKIKDFDKVMVHIGGKILAKKSLADAEKFIQKKKETLLDDGEKIGAEMQSIMSKMGDLDKTLHDDCECNDEECECGHHH